MRPIVSVPLKNGAIAGVIGFILIIILYYLGRHPFLFPPHFDFRIILFSVFLFFTLREFREYFNDGILYFWQAMIIALLFVLIYGVIVATGVIVFSAIKPEFVSDYVRLGTEQLKALPQDIIDQIGKDEYARNLAALPATDSIDFAIRYIVQGLGIGLLISIILSVILRKQPKN